MIYNVVKFLRVIFPFVVTLALWRLSCSWINPAGILSIIPIFYCSFVRPVPWFAPFALIMCFLLDYQIGSGFLWTIYYCLVYAAMNLQMFVDLSHTKKYGLYAFMAFAGPAFLFMIFQDINWANLFGGIATFIVVCAIYIPTVITIRVVQND